MPHSLADKQAINDLVSRYNMAMDHAQANDWADTFTGDGELNIDGKTIAKGRAALVAMVENAAKGTYRGRHWVCNALIDGEGDTARLRMYVLSFNIVEGITPRVMGEYDDKLVRVNSEWKFKQRNITFVAGKSGIVR
ncbi:MAG: nuclear transport factor 2 family protein [Betaproteobacteria bacterium]|nr:nuclear transport factor 2 family protein [Betaproteobacteria bacterium]